MAQAKEKGCVNLHKHDGRVAGSCFRVARAKTDHCARRGKEQDRAPFISWSSGSMFSGIGKVWGLRNQDKAT